MTRKLIINLQLSLLLVLALASQASLAQDEYTELNAAYAATPLQMSHAGAWHGLLGGAMLALQQPVADTRSYVLPLVAVSYRRTFYWHFGQAGVFVLSSANRHARLAIAVKARRGYDPSISPALAGMDKRATSVEAGVHGIWLTQATLISYGVFSDISGHSHGSSAQLSLAHPMTLAPRWHLVPSIAAEWLSAKVVDYYFGVKASEATPSRPAYTGTPSTNLRVGLMLNYRLTRAWSLFAGVGYTRLGTGISNSPIVIHNGVAALHIGAGWHF